ncbi:hypothetical protein ZWY2020_046416 [Hordeum vulgare]|nr:hypothetical protein ZWY2020_046416 [Hordeum vulgare]
MAEKISTLILKVDLGCCPCYKKIRKILCKLQDEESIRSISYDDGKHTIAVAGPFDPHKLSCKIRCKGGKVIKSIHIPPPATNTSAKDKRDKEPPPPPPVEEKPPHNHTSPVTPAGNQEKKPVELELPLGPSLPSPVAEKARPVSPIDVKPPTVEIPSWPAPPQPQPQPMGVGHYCGCRPCYQGYYEGCRCCSCGRVYGYAVSVMPTPAGCYAAGGGGYRSACQLLSEEDPTTACTLM